MRRRVRFGTSSLRLSVPDSAAMRALVPRLLAVALSAFGARQTLALLRLFVAPEAMRAPRAACAILLLPSLVGVALALVPSADGRFAAAALYGHAPRRQAAFAVTRATTGTILVAFAALHMALAPVYTSRPVAIALVAVSISAALGTFATTIASALRFTSRPYSAFALLLALTIAAEALARTAPIGDLASTWVSPVRSLVLQLVAFDARPRFFLALPVHAAIAAATLYGILSERRFVRLAERSFGGP